MTNKLSRQQRRKQEREAAKDQHRALTTRPANNQMVAYQQEVNRRAVAKMEAIDQLTNALMEAQDQMMRTIYEITTLAGLATVLEKGSLVDLLLVLRDRLKQQHDQVYAFLNQWGVFGDKPPTKGLNRAIAWIEALDRALDPQQSDFDGGVSLIELVKQTNQIVGLAIERSKDDFEVILESTRDQEAEAKNKSHVTNQKRSQAEKSAAAKQALADFRNKIRSDCLIVELRERYLKDADPDDEIYEYIKTRSLKTIQNWGV